MAGSPAGCAEPGADKALVALCLSVTITYGVLYYAFTVLAPAIAEDTGWSITAITAAFSAGSLVGAFSGIIAGRIVQHRGPRLVMSGGTVLGAVAVVFVGMAPSFPVFVFAWLLVGVASAGTFYPPAFAALTHWFGAGRVRAITTLTLVAGFASTIFAPLTAWLGEELGWRGTYVLFAGLLLVVNLPLHAFLLRLPWSPIANAEHGPPDRQIVLSRTFLMVAASGALASLAMYASIVHLVPLMLDYGLGVQVAAWALGLSGAGQVAGRMLYPLLDRRLRPNARAGVIISAIAATLMALAVIQGPAPMLIALAVIGGSARGLFTLIGATVVADHWGPARYAALNGIYQAPLGLAAALAPAFGAGVIALGGSYATLFGILAVISLVSAILAMLAGHAPVSRSDESRVRQGTDS